MKKQLATLGLILLLIGSVGPLMSENHSAKGESPNLKDLLDWSVNKAMSSFKDQVVETSPIDGYKEIEVGEGLAFKGKPPLGLEALSFLAPDYFVYITNSTTEYTVIPTEIDVKADIYKRSLFRTKKIQTITGVGEDDLFWNYPNIGDTDGNIGVFLVKPEHYNLNAEISNSKVYALFNIPEKRENPDTTVESIDNSSIILENSTEITVEELKNKTNTEVKNMTVEENKILGLISNYKVSVGGDEN